MNILSLFDEVKIETETLIAEADLGYCTRIEREFHQLTKQLSWAKNCMQRMEAEWTEPNYTYEKFSDYHFFPSMTLEKIDELMEMAKEEYKETIRKYFNEAYNLRISEEEITKCNDWRSIVQKFISVAGGSLRDAGVCNIITDFKKYIWGENPVLVKSKTVSIPRYSIIDSYFGKIYRFNKSYLALVQALSYFETGSTCALNYIEASFPIDKVDTSRRYEVHALCNKLAGIRLYNNGRLDLVFTSKEVANEFYQCFQLNQIEK